MRLGKWKITDSPCDTDAQKHVYSIAASNISDTSICIFILNGSYFTGERIYNASDKKWEKIYKILVFNRCKQKENDFKRLINSFKEIQSIQINGKCTSQANWLRIKMHYKTNWALFLPPLALLFEEPSFSQPIENDIVNIRSRLDIYSMGIENWRQKCQQME